jgi:hypothetical protein
LQRSTYPCHPSWVLLLLPDSIFISFQVFASAFCAHGGWPTGKENFVLVMHGWHGVCILYIILIFGQTFPQLLRGHNSMYATFAILKAGAWMLPRNPHLPARTIWTHWIQKAYGKFFVVWNSARWIRGATSRLQNRMLMGWWETYVYYNTTYDLVSLMNCLSFSAQNPTWFSLYTFTGTVGLSWALTNKCKPCFLLHFVVSIKWYSPSSHIFMYHPFALF